MSYIDKHWYRAVDLDHSLKLDSSFGPPESRPRKHRQTQIDRRSIQRVSDCVEVQAKIGVGVERSSSVDQRPGEIGVDSPIPTFVRIGKRRSSHWSAESAMIKFAALRSQTNFDVAKALAIGQLSKSHRKELIPTREPFRISIPIVTLNTSTKLVVRKKLHDLSENGLSLVHSIPPRGISSLRRSPKNQENHSNHRSSFRPVSFPLSYGYGHLRNV